MIYLLYMKFWYWRFDSVFVKGIQSSGHAVWIKINCL